MNNARKSNYAAACGRLVLTFIAFAALESFVSVRVGGAPPITGGRDNPGVRQTSQVEQLVTGDAEHLGNVVAGYGATLKFYFTPRPPLPGTEASLAYPPGWHIDDQKLTVSRGGFTSAWITQIEGWNPGQYPELNLRVFQDKIDAGGFKGANALPPNSGCDLTYPAGALFACQKTCLDGINFGLPCLTNSNCPGSSCNDPCPEILGEPGPKCSATNSGFCDWGWQNTTRADWVFAATDLPDQIPVTGILSPTGPYFAGDTNPGTGPADDGSRYYTGTLVLPVPACAKGTYTIGHVAAECGANGQCQPGCHMLIAALVSGVMDIQLGSCCTNFATTNSATCTEGVGVIDCDALSSTNLHIFRPNVDCTTPCEVECVTAADCDDQKLCTQDSCTSDGHCVHNYTDAVCDDGVDCTTDQCVAPSDSCVHTTVDAKCDDGLYCNGMETCTSNGCQPGEPPCGLGETCDETNDSCGLTPIPTVSQWGLASLALVLLIGAKVVLRRMAQS